VKTPSTATVELLERDGDLEQIDEALAAARAGSGRCVAITGAPGIGKSSLLERAAVGAEGAGMSVLRARGSDLEHEFALGVVIQLLAPCVATLEGPRRDDLFSGAAGLARPLFDDAPDRAAAAARLFARFHGLHWLCARLAESGPLALLVDDAHWADAASLQFLAYLQARLGELPVCVVLATRTGEPGSSAGALEELLAREPVTRIAPCALSSAAIAELARGRLGPGADTAIGAECARVTGGNPLLARELLATLAGRNGSRLDVEAIAAVGPPSIGRLVDRRLKPYPPDVLAAARALAILGDDGSLAVAASIAALDTGAAALAADALIAAEILEPSLPPRFAHPIVRQAIHDSIAPGERGRLHLAAARELATGPGGSERAAAHLLAAGTSFPAGEPWAADALMTAAGRAGRSGAPDQAARFLQRALHETLPQPQRRAILLALGAAETGVDPASAIGHLVQARDLSGDGSERAAAALGLALACFHAADFGQAAAACEDALRNPEALDRELRLALEFQATSILLVAGLPGTAARQRLRELEREVAAGATPGERTLLALLSVFAGGSADRPATETASLAERAWAQGALLADIGSEHPAFVFCATAMALAGRLSRSAAVWTAGAADGQRRGSMLGSAVPLAFRGYALAEAGDLTAAEVDATAAHALIPPGEPLALPSALATLARVHLERGAVGEAERLMSEGFPAGDFPRTASITHALVARGDIALRMGDLERALADYTDAGRVCDALGFKSPSGVMWRTHAALACVRLGQAERAHELLAEELALAHAVGAPESVGEALRVQAGLAGRADMPERTRAAVEVLEGSEARLAHARALIDHGAALRRAGHPREGRGPLREGLDAAHRCGSPVETERALDELRAAGGRPRRPALRGVDALSPQERRIAAMAAEGMSNREIAEALFLGRRTVEMHLSGAYTKLGVPGRTELAAALVAS
jgi:DNA-binding CsgD family transcriptional regulator